MSDWDEFCENFKINPNDPEEFDNLIDSFSKENEKILIHKITGTRRSFSDLADKSCGRCNGTGYIGRYSWNCNGRCFKCIPDYIWNQFQYKLE